MILINPYYDRAQKLGIYARYVPLSVPMGIGALAGYLLQQGKTVRILDEHLTLVTDEVLDDYVKDLSQPYIFGISCVSAGIGRGYELAKMIKTKYPDAQIPLPNVIGMVTAETHEQADIRIPDLLKAPLFRKQIQNFDRPSNTPAV